VADISEPKVNSRCTRWIQLQGVQLNIVIPDLHAAKREQGEWNTVECEVPKGISLGAVLRPDDYHEGSGQWASSRIGDATLKAWRYALGLKGRGRSYKEDTEQQPQFCLAHVDSLRSSEPMMRPNGPRISCGDFSTAHHPTFL
jgi:hypothetical protein